MASSKQSNGKGRVFVDELNGIRTALYSNAHLALEMSSYSHPSQQLDSRVATPPSSTETSPFFKPSADEECKSTSDSHLTLGSIVHSSTSHGSFVDCPSSLSSNCGELGSTPNRVNNVSPEILPRSNYTCSSQQLAPSTVLPLSSARGVVTINRETQNETRQLEEVEKSVQLELSECSFSSQEIAKFAPSQSPDSHGISCMDNPGCSNVNQTGLLMDEPGNSVSVISDNSEQSTISSYQSDQFVSDTPQQSNTEKSSKASDISSLLTNHGCAGKSSVDTNDQGLLSSKETNDQDQGSVLSSKETNCQCKGSETNDLYRGSVFSSKETNDQYQGSVLSSKETNDQCQGSVLSSKETNCQCKGSETNDLYQGCALSNKENNDQCQGSALSSKETNDQCQVSASSSNETNDPCQVSASSSKETNDPCRVSASSSKDSSSKLYNFVIFSHEDDATIVDLIFNLLEQKHHLRGFKIGRDDTPGTYKNDEVMKAIKNSEKILLLLTPKSIDNGNFKYLLTLSLTHSIEKKNNTKLIPIRCGIHHGQIPEVLRTLYHLDYDDFSDNFKDRLSRVFHSKTSSSSQQSDSHSASPRCGTESESSAKSSDSSKLKQSHSMPPSSPHKKRWYDRFLSSPK